VYGCFFSLDFFSWLFVAADVLTPRTFCHHGRFVAMVVLSPDVLSLWTLCDGRLVAERFVWASNLYCSKRRSQLSADPIPGSSASWYTDSTISGTFFFLLHNVQCWCPRTTSNGQWYAPVLELNDHPEVSVYLPDGTWCHHDGDSDYYCRYIRS
jgi:hypothetical protein